MLLKAAVLAVQQHSMFSRGDRVMIAVSGGIDSVVLLDVLHRLSSVTPVQLVVGHVDHGLRDDSARDAELVEDLARSYGLPVSIRRLHPSELAAVKTLGREGAARRARLRTLEAMAEETGAVRIALGHTADDRAETVLQRLTRGTGPMGLTGMLPVRLPFVRPLIAARRTQVQSYANARHLRWREDPMNQDLSLARNRIRLCVLPELQRINPRAVEAINRAADLTVQLTTASTDSVDRATQTAVSTQAGQALCWSRSTLCSLPPSMRSYVIREIIRRGRGSLEGITHQHIEAIDDLLESRHGHGQISLPGAQLLIDQDSVFLERTILKRAPSLDTPIDLGRTVLPGGAAISVVRLPREDLVWSDVASTPWVEALDAERVSFPLHLRSRRAGDSFTPLGMDHTQKLKDFFINQRIPHRLRDRVPLLCDPDGIVWVVGVRIAQRVRLTENTEHVLRLEAEGMT